MKVKNGFPFYLSCSIVFAVNIILLIFSVFVIVVEVLRIQSSFLIKYFVLAIPALFMNRYFELVELEFVITRLEVTDSLETRFVKNGF